MFNIGWIGHTVIRTPSDVEVDNRQTPRALMNFHHFENNVGLVIVIVSKEVKDTDKEASS